MSGELEEFYKEFFQDIHGVADADGRYAEDAFFELFTSQLVEAGELENGRPRPYAPPRGGVRVDGYGGDPSAADGVLSLIISHSNQSDLIATLTASDMDAIFKRLTNFLTRALDATLRNAFEESTSAFGLADLIAKRWSGVSKVRLFLISNRILSSRVDGREAGEYRGVPVTYSVWDGRLQRFVTTGAGREDILINLETEFGGPLPAAAHLKSAGYEAYLIVIPGKQCSQKSTTSGARGFLSRKCVSSFKARGNVNKGIRTTLETDPEMFFAYNNGITATAEKVTTKMSDAGLLVTELNNLQIVNGGQTTASIHAASRKKDVDLSKVFVQMKLSVVVPAKAIEVVPKISEFANSQNRVNAADFFANHPYHVQLEKVFQEHLCAVARRDVPRIEVVL